MWFSGVGFFCLFVCFCVCQNPAGQLVILDDFIAEYDQ